MGRHGRVARKSGDRPVAVVLTRGGRARLHGTAPQVLPTARVHVQRLGPNHL